MTLSITVFTCRLLLLLAAGLLAAGCGGGSGGSAPPQPPPAPAALIEPADDLSGWTAATLPDATGTALRELLGAVRASRPAPDALGIAHRGRLALDVTLRTGTDRFDAEAGNLDPRLHAQFSVTKSLAALLVGVATRRGDLPADLATPYLPLLPYPSYDNPSPAKSAITFEDVLSMRLGIDWNEFDPPYSSPDNQLNRFLAEAVDFTRTLLDRPMAADPGTAFAYNTVAATTLGTALETAQGLPLEDYAAAYLLQPMEISSFGVLRTPTGLPDLGRGLLLTTRDLLKFGQLVLDDGAWKDNRLVNAGWVGNLLTPRTTLSWATPADHRWQLTGYGLLWWTGTFEVDGVSYETAVARGFGDQLLVVVPALELVVAINSGNYDTDSGERALFALIAERILPIFADL